MKNNLSAMFSWATFLSAASVILIFEVGGIYTMSAGNDNFAGYLFLIVGNALAAIGLYRTLRNGTYSNIRGVVQGFWYAFLGQVYSFVIIIVAAGLTGFGG